MKRNIIFILLTLSILLLRVSSSRADFNPGNPAEPNIKYKVSVSTIPADVAYTSGTGEYQDSTSVWIRSSSRYGQYKFSHWTLNGEKIDKAQQFSYVMPRADVTFVAHYTYQPDSPSDPQAVFKRCCYLVSEPAGVATFNRTSGSKYQIGSSVYLRAYYNGSYSFAGWYKGDEKVSTNIGFDYTIPDSNDTLVARFVFDPSNPQEPTTFYSQSCAVTVLASDSLRGTVSVSELTDGRALYGSTITATASVAKGFVFGGWSDGKKIISSDATYAFTVKDDMRNVMLKAMFFAKAPGDADGDGKASVADVTSTIDEIIGKTASGTISTDADINGDGSFDISDIVQLIGTLKNKGGF